MADEKERISELSPEELKEVKGGIPYEKPGLEKIAPGEDCGGGSGVDGGNCVGGYQPGSHCTGGTRHPLE